MLEKNSATPGQQLLSAREALRLSQEDIAKHTRLSVEIIHDIEQDDYARFSAPVFVRGYLRSYARLVNVSEKEILDKLESCGLMPQEIAYSVPVADNAPVVHMSQKRLNPRYFRIASIVGSAVLVIALAIAWQGDRTADSVKTVDAQTSANASSLALSQPIDIAATAATNDQTAAPAAPPKKQHHHRKIKTAAANTTDTAKNTQNALQPTYTLAPVKQS